ncbi:uncharacterized protein TNCV_4450321 [Trichonephila clavipes]|nr:uncharacterized protein TNCV_4450321 [Trichonephila clavipes]
MDFTEINSRAERGELLGRIDRQNSRFRTAKTIIIKFGLHASFVELESAKNALNEVGFLSSTLMLHTFIAGIFFPNISSSIVMFNRGSFTRRGSHISISNIVVKYRQRLVEGNPCDNPLQNDKDDT